MVKDISVSEENQNALLNHVLENEIFVIVANLVDISIKDIIISSLPSFELFVQVMKVVDFFLSYI